MLDFFAGSGTTAQAVMELNAEDGGNRKFILVQIDEPIKEEKSKAAYDFCKNELKSKAPVISDITIERVKRAAANPKDAFSILSLESKPTLITRKKGTLELMENDDLTPRDKALNLALHDRKPLHRELTELFKDRLYQCEDSLYLIACDDEVLEFLRTHPSEQLYIDGYGNFRLDDFLNLTSNHSITIVYNVRGSVPTIQQARRTVRR